MTGIACPRCAAVNPSGNLFCGACGSPIRADGPSTTAEERKVVTMLFADLTASTEMAARLDPEDLRAVLHPFFDAMAEEIGRYGGTVEKFIGDAVVAAFGAPIAHEDDPDRAVRCALEMHHRLAELNAEVAARAGGDLAMRIGINTGEVIAHGAEEGIVTGEAVNIAARFQAIAEPGRVVVGERTYRHTRDRFAFADLGEVWVKGAGRPLRVWRVDGVLVAPGGSVAAQETPFVGRDPEAQRLRSLFERTVRERRPNLVTIVGPPGIGKSRLAHEFARSLALEGARVCRGRCLPYGDGLTYWPLAEILKADAGILDSDAPAAILEKARARLDPRFPGEEGLGVTGVLLSSIGVEVPSDPLAGTEPQAARRVIARAWQRYLESMSADGPVLALIEDIHWGDPSLLELLEAVVPSASGPMLVLCMARPDLFERRPDWGGMSGATTLSLAPLSAADAAVLIDNLLEGVAPDDVVEAILSRSEGNPFFAVELLRMMIEDGTLVRADGRWGWVRELPSSLPDTVQGVIASRIDLLPAEQKRVIQDASVVGRAFWADAVATLGGPGIDTAIDGLVSKGLVREAAESTIAGERELIFNHILTRDVAYASIPRARRPKAHRAIGAWVERVTRGRDEEFSEILAHHFELAGDAGRTARYAMLAGNRQLRVFATEQAIDWYDRALDAVPKENAEERSRIALARGVALEHLVRFGDALAAYEAALDAAREASHAELEARALAARAHTLWLLDRYDEGRELLPLALERARTVGLADVEARLLYTAGTMRFGRGEFAEALPLHRQALDIATASGDREGEALAHHGLCETLYFLGPFEEGLAHGERADELLRALGQRSMVAHNGYMVAWTMTFLGRMDEARAIVEATVETAREIGNRRDEAFALYNRSLLSVLSGRVDDAWADVTTGEETFRELGLLRGELVGVVGRGDISAEAGDVNGVRACAQRAIEISDLLGGSFLRPAALALNGWAVLASGDPLGTAQTWFAQARSFDDAVLDVGWSTRIEIAAGEWIGDPAILLSAAARLEQRLPPTTTWGAWAPYGRALAALLAQDHEEAGTLAMAARDAATAIGDTRLRWRTSRVAWKALEALGRPDEAAAARDDAREIVRGVVAGASGHLRDAFLARLDVAELLA